ncbi:hypothetical protein [Kineococcus esterisolvens]|uniref:hypothetical protein n=1 Tax=unclassified Kineococcus TaxID=2621656 RepID=UPI003D7C868E
MAAPGGRARRTAARAAPPGTAPRRLGRWRHRLDALAAHPERLRLVLHPVVDVAGGRCCTGPCSCAVGPRTAPS